MTLTSATETCPPAGAVSAILVHSLASRLRPPYHFTHAAQWLSWYGGLGEILENTWKLPGLLERAGAQNPKGFDFLLAV